MGNVKCGETRYPGRHESASYCPPFDSGLVQALTRQDLAAERATTLFGLRAEQSLRQVKAASSSALILSSVQKFNNTLP